MLKTDKKLSFESIVWNKSRFEIIRAVYGDFYVELQR